MNPHNMKIVADSSSDVLTMADVPFASAPLKIITTQKEYVDDAALDVISMANDMLSYTDKSSTACPGIGDWLDAFGDAPYVFCVTITKNLSGSYNAAMLAKADYEEQHPDRKVFVIDSLSTGPEMKLIMEKLRELILSGLTYEEICTAITAYQEDLDLLFMLESLQNLANNGRVSHLAAKAVGILGIRVVGKASDVGTLEQLDKCRGEKKALPTMLGYMEQFGYQGGKVRIAHCQNPQAAAKLQELVQSKYPSATFEIYPARGLVTFYAEKGGMLVGFERKLQH